MKAKDYAQRWIDSGKSDAGLLEVGKQMIGEIPRLCEQRNAKKSDARIAVFREIDDKWKAFARCFPNEVGTDGLRILMLKRLPGTRQLHHLIWPGKTIPAE
jgi:hypothetical protein